MRNDFIDSRSLILSAVLHALFIGGFASYELISRLFRKPPPPASEFTIVLPPPESVAAEPDPEPETVETPAPVKDAVSVEKKPTTPKPQPKPQPKPKPKPQPKPKPKPTEKKPFQKGKRVEAPKVPEKPKVDFTKFKRVVTQPVKALEKPLSAKEIRDALNAGARPGARNQIPENEMARCVGLVRTALFESWDAPPETEHILQPPHLEIRLDRGGRIISYRLVRSSGNKYYDETVKKAALNTEPIRGLSIDFLKQYERLTIEFRLQ
ncbi:MAG: TonB C-terminal domain-containing protein [Kiritimatiellae bacterium]|nr:TonB C-terminal domain-containing protein [Kiritimatiellia bacterium]